MSEAEGLVYAYLIAPDGSGRALNWEGVEHWQADQGLLWLHLDCVDPQALDWLEQRSGLQALTRESLLDEGTRPRHTSMEDGLLVILRGVNCNVGQDPDDMVALRMLFTEKRIITLRRRRLMALQDIQAEITAGKGPAGAGEFLVKVAGHVADRMGDVIADIDDKIDELEEALVAGESHSLRPRLADLRRQCINLRRYIAPQRDMLARLLNDRIAWLDDTDRLHLRETAERTARFVEDIDAARERAAISQEELNNRISEQMNKAMYTLSIVAAIFLPLGLLTGLLGINVGGIPGTENNWAFTLVTAALVALAVGLLYWFRKIKWL